jgi:microtubule-associated protein-like 6
LQIAGVSRTIDSEHIRRADHVAVENVNSLSLTHVFGYRGYDCGHNVYYVDNGTTIVYHTAGVGVVQNVKTGLSSDNFMWTNTFFSGEQRFYTGHTDDILCLALNDKQPTIVATGQIALHAPTVHVWDVMSMQTKSILTVQHDQVRSTLTVKLT